MGVPKIKGTVLGVPIIRIIVFWGLYWGSPCFGKLPHELQNCLFLSLKLQSLACMEIIASGIHACLRAQM